MERERLKLILRNLKLLIESLESEIYSDVQSYTNTKDHCDDPIDYTIYNDDDGYPD
jgi:hypothetical protein